MATMTALKFPDVDGARRALARIDDLQTQHLLVLHDAAIVEWPRGRRKPRTEQLHSQAGTGALSGAFWGLLFGLLFFVPLLGAALGALTGALSGSLVDVGVDDRFIARVREQVRPGASALFLHQR